MRRPQPRPGRDARFRRRICPTLRLRAGQQGKAMCPSLILVQSSGETDDHATYTLSLTMTPHTLRGFTIGPTSAKYAGLYKENRFILQ
jgi:hypothetical protein